MPREGHAEGARGAVADVLRNLGDGDVLAPQEILRQRHAPAEQILHRRNAHCATEALEEGRTPERGLVRQLCNRPRPAWVLVHPSECYRQAEKERVSQYLRLDNGLVSLLTCLASDFPFVFGFSVYESFESSTVAQTGVVQMPKRGERLVGGHAVVAAGYDLAAKRFVVRNSWGARWGQHGYFTMPFDYVTDPYLAADFWTIRQVPVV